MAPADVSVLVITRIRPDFQDSRKILVDQLLELRCCFAYYSGDILFSKQSLCPLTHASCYDHVHATQ